MNRSDELIKYCDYFIDLLNQLKIIIKEKDDSMDICDDFNRLNLNNDIYKIRDKLYNEYCILLSLISKWILENK
jgi:Zn-dependent M16 (insulinase) family peptidase